MDPSSWIPGSSWMLRTLNWGVSFLFLSCLSFKRPLNPAKDSGSHKTGAYVQLTLCICSAVGNMANTSENELDELAVLQGFTMVYPSLLAFQHFIQKPPTETITNHKGQLMLDVPPLGAHRPRGHRWKALRPWPAKRRIPRIFCDTKTATAGTWTWLVNQINWEQRHEIAWGCMRQFSLMTCAPVL